MPSDPYTIVDDHLAPSQSSPSQESTSSARYTPDSDSEDSDDEGREGLRDLEAGQGYEMQAIEKRSPQPAQGGAKEEAEALLDGDEDETARRKRRRRASVQSFELYTPDEKRAVRRKLDTHLVLAVALLYLLSFLDRSNIGNAKIAGLQDDLQLSTSQYQWLLTAFYLTYIAFEWMTVCYQLFRPHVYLAICVFSWGILASLQSLATTFPYLLVLRALLGIGEAAFVGIPFYLTFFFKREEMALRTGIFVAAAPLATSFAGTLAWAIVSIGDRTGIASWRLLFLVEGFPAVLVAVWCWYWIPDSPSTARWLNLRERKIATLRLRKEGGGGSETSEKGSASQTQPRHKRKFNFREVLRTLADPKSYLTAGMFFCCNVAFSSMPVFLPTIIHAMGFSKLSSQALSAPPFLFAFISVLLTAYLSDRLKSRSIPIIFHALAALSGYLFLTSAGKLEIQSHILRYLAVYPICAGFFSAVTVVITWTVNNQASDEGKGTGMAVLNVIGQMGPLIGTRLYPDDEGPFYVKGMAVCAGAMGMVVLLAIMLRVVLGRENRKARQEGMRDVFVYML